MLSYGLRNHLYFNDDHEQIARALFFHDIYRDQFSVHMPVPAIVAHVVLSAIGTTHDANRLLAGLLNAALLAAIALLARAFVPARAAAFATLFGGLCWLGLENDFWAFMDVSQLYSAVFFYAGLAATLTSRRQATSEQRALARPWLLGSLWALALLSRVLIVEQVVISALGIAALGFKPRQSWKAFLSQSLAGGLLTTLAVAAVFHDRLPELLYWTVQHNLAAKSGQHFNPLAWIGNLSNPVIAQTYVRIGVLWLFAFLSARFATARADAAQKNALLWLTVFLSGWLASNPSGIGDTLMQAIAAAPALCIAVGIAVGQWSETPAPSGHPHSAANLRVGRVSLLMAGLLALNAPALERLYTHVVAQDAAPQLAFTAQRGRYIDTITTPRQRIFIFGADPLLYVASRRESATFASILFEDLAPYADAIASAFEKARPAAVIFDPSDFWFLPDFYRFPRLTDQILRNYTTSSEATVLVPNDSPFATGWAPIQSQREVDAINGALAAAGIECNYRFRDVPRLATAHPFDTLHFAQDGAWAESAAPAGFQVDGGTVLRLRSANNFGGFFASGDAHLRVLLAAPDGRTSWAWIGKAQLLSKDEAEIPLKAFSNGTPPLDLPRLNHIAIGGWGPRGVSVELSGLEVFTRRLHRSCQGANPGQ